MPKQCPLIKRLVVVCFVALFANSALADSTIAKNPKPICGFGGLLFDSNFPAARLNHCIQTGENEYTLGIYPENQPINPSPWYAFKVLSERNRDIIVFIYNATGAQRYPPKISKDGKEWTLMDTTSYQFGLQNRYLQLKLKVGSEPITIAAQEIIDNQYYKRWFDTLRELPYLDIAVMGYSLQRRPITRLIARGEGKEWVLLVGRQHPPEVTGALALFRFVETVLTDSQLASKFRQRFNLLIIPNLNPDGVAAGNWRHNMNGIDLNRDWGNFTQPETKMVADKLNDILNNDDQKLVLGLDFHSTKEDIFYTQRAGTVPHLSNFTDQWLARIQQQVPAFKVKAKSSTKIRLGIFKNYLSKKYGIPAITYEMGDNTDRALINEVAEVAAINMMKLLLASPPPVADE